MMRRRGFTLLEILVVIGIVVLLAAILLPVLARVREKGRQAACLSNLRQLGAAMQMYLQDYERYPHAIDPADKYAPQIWQDQAIAQGYDIPTLPALTDVLAPYVKNKEMWHCPSDSGFDAPDGVPWQLEGEPTRPSCYGKYGTSYFYRTELMFRNLLEGSLPEPVKTNVLFDASGDWHGAGPSWRTAQRYCVLFADGHVKNVNHDTLSEAWSTPVQ